MKILFICSSLEPGKDGVGDYTRRLACELIRQGIRAKILALNDRFVTDTVIELQNDEGTTTSVLRIPINQGSKERFKQAKEYIDDFNPKWLSLQFVIFGHHPKGLPFGFGKKLQLLGEGKKWHLMFHELWVGMAQESSTKEKYWGLVQKQIIKNIVENITPKLIHTQSKLYQVQLTKLNIKSDILPLFGNIPVKQTIDKKITIDNSLTLIIFGTIHPGSTIKQFVNDAAEYLVAHPNVKINIQIIGKSGDEIDNWISIFECAGMNFKIWGEQPANVISEVLSSASLGISSSAFTMIEKSGTVAAMREHGLNIICVGNAYNTKGITCLTPPDSVFEYMPGNFEYYISKIGASKSQVNINYVGNMLLQALINNQAKITKK